MTATNYFYTYNAIFDAPVSGNAKLVYAYLCKCANRDGRSWPSHKAIAYAAGICVTTVKKAISELERSGFISVRGQARPERGQCANIYAIIKDKVKSFFMTYANVFTEKLTAKARIVYLYFCRLASGRLQAFPSHKTTARACGLSVAGTRTAVDELEEVGLIERKAQFRDNGGQRSNLYTLIMDAEDGEDTDDCVDESEIASKEETSANVANSSIDIENTLKKPFEYDNDTNSRGFIFEVLRKFTSFFVVDKTDSRHKATGVVTIKHPPLPRGGYGT